MWVNDKNRLSYQNSSSIGGRGQVGVSRHRCSPSPPKDHSCARACVATGKWHSACWIQYYRGRRQARCIGPPIDDALCQASAVSLWRTAQMALTSHIWLWWSQVLVERNGNAFKVTLTHQLQVTGGFYGTNRFFITRQATEWCGTLTSGGTLSTLRTVMHVKQQFGPHHRHMCFWIPRLRNGHVEVETHLHLFWVLPLIDTGQVGCSTRRVIALHFLNITLGIGDHFGSGVIANRAALDIGTLLHWSNQLARRLGVQ